MPLRPVSAATHGVVDRQALHLKRSEAAPDVRVIVDAHDRLALELAELRALDPQTQKAANNALKLLQKHPSAKSLRLHSLKGYAKPTIWKIDVFANKSYQVTFEMVGEVAHLKRIATHADIDRAPR